MKVYVQGLWHLGTVTAACLASLGHDVVGVDFDEKTINSLNDGKPPIFEPALEDMVKSGLASEKLHFVSNLSGQDIEFLWIAYDTPVDENDNADVDFVIEQLKSTLPYLSTGAMVLISSQMPIGSVGQLETMANELYPEKHINFAYSPENLRLGNAINVFLRPDRIIVGTRNEKDKSAINSLLSSITNKIEWMSVESAEMTKHAINSFLATSVVFANEIASLCEVTGADAKEVERGLKSEQRIGPKAYLSPGSAFSGGTLARDIEFLKDVSKKHNLRSSLLESVKTSNDEHKSWVRRKIQHIHPVLKGADITVWGITYKSGTDTLRRSLWVELCNWLIEQDANVKIYDPVVKEFPKEWQGSVQRFNSMSESLINTSTLLIGTEYPAYKEFFNSYDVPNKLTVIDSNRFLSFLSKSIKVNYISVGTPLNKKWD